MPRLKLTVIGFFSLFVPMLGATSAPVLPAEATNDLIAGYGYNEVAAMYKSPYNFAQSSTITSQIPATLEQVDYGAAQSAEKLMLKYMLSANPAAGATGKDAEQGSIQATQVVATIPTTAYADPKSTPNNLNLSAGTILDAVQYKDSNTPSSGATHDADPLATTYTEENAKNFTTALLHLGGVTDLQPPQDKGTVSPNSSLAVYLANYNAYVAAQSIAANVSASLMAERSVVPNLGCTAGVAAPSACQSQAAFHDYAPPASATLPKDISPLRLQNFLATYRLAPEWKNQMATSQHTTPMQVQKETLFVLSEIEYALYRIHLDNERMMALLAAAQIQNSVNYRNIALVNQHAAAPSNTSAPGNAMATKIQGANLQSKPLPTSVGGG